MPRDPASEKPRHTPCAVPQAQTSTVSRIRWQEDGDSMHWLLQMLNETYLRRRYPAYHNSKDD